jgi:hypothetical protein
MPKYITFLFVLLSFSTIAQQNIDEELIIFVQKEADSKFTQKNIKVLIEQMEAANIPTRIIDIEKVGSPKEVGFTPHIVYRNHIGNKTYKGRYTSHGRILNFIRTVRRLPQQDIDYEEKNIFVWKQERCNILFKLKITAAKGNLPSDFNLANFEKEYLNGLKIGFERAGYATLQKVNNSDEIFYCNFYPYIAEDGKVYVGHEIFSHYDCINPIYKQFDKPGTGNSVEEGFTAAANSIFLEIKRQVDSSEMGDAMNFVPTKIKKIPWKKLNLKKLEAPTKGLLINAKEVKFTKDWILLGPIDDDTPLLTFNFPPPLRQYGGELKKVTGTMSFKEDKTLQNATGEFIVKVSSLEMGDGSLNHSVKESMLFVDQFPDAQLEFSKITSDDFKLELGKITRASIEAQLTMVQKSDTIVATAQFEPFLNDKGELLIEVTTQFILPDLVGSYKIDGPDGPKEANNTIQFNASFLMKAVSPEN